MTDCKLCDGRPIRRRYRYFDGANKGAVVDLCPHEYNQRLTNGEDLALVLGQTVPVPGWVLRK